MYIERGREGERKSVCERGRERKRGREQESECVGVCVCEREKTPSQYSRAFPSPCSPAMILMKRHIYTKRTPSIYPLPGYIASHIYITSQVYRESTFYISSHWMYLYILSLQSPSVVAASVMQLHDKLDIYKENTF